MTLDELFSATPTESEYISGRMVLEMLAKEDWRCYSSLHYWNTKNLIDRFMRIHARIKGLVSEEVYAELPATIIHYEPPGEIIRGATFLNGAVLIVKPVNQPPVYSLFVDDYTANRWGYPDTYKYLAELKAP